MEAKRAVFSPAPDRGAPTGARFYFRLDRLSLGSIIAHTANQPWEIQSCKRNSRSFLLTAFKMGRVRTKTVKKSAKVIIERYYPKLTLDFETNKRICDEIAIIASKRLRNKVCSTVSSPRGKLTESSLCRLPGSPRI